MSEHRSPDDRRRRLGVDLPALLLVLLVGAFVLIAATVAYGFATKTLDPGIVLGVVATMFTGLLTGILAAGRRTPSDQDHGDGESP